VRVIHLARKPLSASSVASNILEHETGALNIDACRVSYQSDADLERTLERNPGRHDRTESTVYGSTRPQQRTNPEGRWPNNVVLQHLPSCRPVGCGTGCPVLDLDVQSGDRKTTWVSAKHANNRDGEFLGAMGHPGEQGYNDSGGASRFYMTLGGDDG
jgi:hypothetical protein